MEITAKITGVKYDIKLNKSLDVISYSNFDINTCPTSCIVNNGKSTFAISKWVSPKRTRSYPYERVYNTLPIAKKIAVVPVIKDEGIDGDRDFIQWDTVSMMSLLDVYVILVYYDSASKHGKYRNKLIRQRYNNSVVLDKIRELSTYYSSALHWNLREMTDNLSITIDRSMMAYNAISDRLNVQMHDPKGVDRFKQIIDCSIDDFMRYSRDKAQNAQTREFLTDQPNERLQSDTKSKVTITNYLGGQYYLTVDETNLINGTVELIEGKHSQKSKLPGLSDIKDGLTKMILYSNLQNVTFDGEPVLSKPVLSLSSDVLMGYIDSTANDEEIEKYVSSNTLSSRQRHIVNTLFEEANENSFSVRLRGQ